LSEAPLDSTVLFLERDCGGGGEDERPEFIGGGIMVDTLLIDICGRVVEPDGMGGFKEVVGATVQLWADFPLDAPLAEDMSSHWGSFAFSEVGVVQFDLWAFKEGYYPTLEENLDYTGKGIEIVIYPLAELVPTDKWVDYYCDDNTLMGLPLPVGSIVEAYVGSMLVGQQTVTEPGVYRFMPVYRDDEYTTEVDGAVAGDILTFYVNGDEAIAHGDIEYPDKDFDFDSREVCLEAGATVPRTCELAEGWNLISWNINTESDYILDVFGPIMDSLDVILGFEQGGLTYDPDLPQFSTLWYVDHLSGYWVRVKDGKQVTLELEGLPVPASYPIAVTTGWNLVSYLPSESLTPHMALATVHDHLIVAYGFDGVPMIYEPGMSTQNTLDMMHSCFGYWLKVTADGQLVYPSFMSIPVPPLVIVPVDEAARMAPPDVTPTRNWVNLYGSSLTLDGEIVQAGATISAHSAEGIKVGGFTLTEAGTFGFMPVYADDPESGQGAGLRRGEKFYLSVNGIETNEELVWTDNGEAIEVTNLTAKTGSDVPLPDSYWLGQNYPNPFNPMTSISFQLPTAGHARLEIYNVLGKLVAVAFDGMATSGENVVIWEGTDAFGEKVSSGVYFYRLTSGDFTETRKMMLLK
jgi:hypothetical protein